MTDFLIRPETDGDREGIARLLLAAFPTSWEARLGEQLRRDGDVMFSLVAVAASGVIGHAFSLECAHRMERSPWRRSP